MTDRKPNFLFLLPDQHRPDWLGCHGSLLPSARANHLLGFFTGVLVFTSFRHWRWEHSVHHATAGDLDRRGVEWRVFEDINFDLGHQWGTGDSGTTKSEARLQYNPAQNKILNLAYRFRRDSLEQGDVSWSWPVGRRWNFVGRYNFSFRDEEVLEQFFGLEYESCCWGLRMVTRRYISTRDGTRDTTYGLQLVLKGMASVVTAADKLLERGILGYSADPR